MSDSILNSPTISVVTATLNCRSTISDCLASVAAQTWPHRQHVVVDGASTDGTLEFLRAHCDQISVLQSEPDRGIYDALNKGLALSTGDVVGFLNADDFYAHPEVLELVAAAFADPAVCAVYGSLNYVKQRNITKVVRRWRSTPFTPRRLAWGWMPPHPSLYVRRGFYQSIGGFDARYRIAADYLSILQLFSLPGFTTVQLPDVLVTMRLGGTSNKSLLNVLRKTAEDWQALRDTRVGALWGGGALAWKNLSKLSQFM